MESMESINTNQTNESYKFVFNSLNKACEKGVFNLEEAYLLRVSMANIDRALQAVIKGQEQNKPTVQTKQ